MMPDDPKPLSPEEVDALERSDMDEWSEIGKRLFATVRDRGRQIEHALDNRDDGVIRLRVERDELQRKYDLVQLNFTALGGKLAETTQQRDGLQRQLADESPGTPLGRLKAIGEWAEAHCGHNPASARPCELTIIEYVEKLERQLDDGMD